MSHVNYVMQNRKHKTGVTDFFRNIFASPSAKF